MNPLFFQAFVYLSAALIVVPAARRVGLGSVLGYLLAGAVIGPWVLGLVGDEGGDVMHFAEFGVVMMLFLVGLELEPERLWRLRGPILGLGGLQVAGTAAVVAGGGVALGLPWQQAVAIGLIVAMSSTAIALQSLAERALLRTDAGQNAFAVLLFQDIAVIPMLAGFPLLATLEVHGAHDASHGTTLVDGLSPWAHAGVVFAAVAAVVAAGRWVVPVFMRRVADTGLREMFTAASLLLVVGVTVLMSAVGLSPALGTFLAGVVLANSEYRHELETDVEPFKGLLLGLFFLSVGASIDFGLVAAQPVTVGALVLGVTALKAGVLVVLARRFGLRSTDTAIFAASLSQVGEFAFVLLSFAVQGGVLPDDLASTLVAVTALSMALSPLVLVANERLVLPRLAGGAGPTRESDVQDDHPPVIIAGYGRFGQIAGRFLRMNGIEVTVLDVDGEQVDMLRFFGQKVFYGDASRLDLLRAAGAEQAQVLVIAVDDHQKVMEIANIAKKHLPHLALLARARGRSEAYELHDLGVEAVYRETFDTSLRVGVDVFRMLRGNAHLALRLGRKFRKHDEASLVELAALRDDDAALASTSRERVKVLEQVLQDDAREIEDEANDPAWDSEVIRQGVADPAGRL